MSSQSSGAPSLGGDLDVDVAIVGAGFTGLWTALSLGVADPALRVAVLEREVAGFGASGRNGGWCSAIFAASEARIERDHGRQAAAAMRRAMRQSVDEVGRAASAEGIDCQFAKGGTVVLARNAVQVGRAKAEVAAARARGDGDDDLTWLGPAEARALVGAEDVLGGTYTPHCAALHPARLARGLADAVTRRGTTVYEHTAARAIEPGGPGRRPRGPHRAGHDHRRRGRTGPRSVDRLDPRRAPDPRSGVLADDRHRAPGRRLLGRRPPGPAGDLLRRAAHDHLRAAHG